MQFLQVGVFSLKRLRPAGTLGRCWDAGIACHSPWQFLLAVCRTLLSQWRQMTQCIETCLTLMSSKHSSTELKGLEMSFLLCFHSKKPSVLHPRQILQTIDETANWYGVIKYPRCHRFALQNFPEAVNEMEAVLHSRKENLMQGMFDWANQSLNPRKISNSRFVATLHCLGLVTWGTDVGVETTCFYFHNHSSCTRMLAHISCVELALVGWSRQTSTTIVTSMSALPLTFYDGKTPYSMFKQMQHSPWIDSQ
jgi:hypothetical protein